jgi:two-component system, response regulator YesN
MRGLPNPPRLGAAARPIFLKYAATNMAILALPIVLAGVFYAVTAGTVTDAVDAVARAQLDASARDVDRGLRDIQRAAARMSIDYDVNLYLNDEGPYSAIEEYDLRKISDKLGTFSQGNELLGLLMIYFSKSDYVVFDSGACPYDSFYGPMFSIRGEGAAEWKDRVLLAGGEDRRIGALEATYSERVFDCALSIHPIGQGSYRRGAIVGMIDDAGLVRLLAGLPEAYGGFMAVYDGSGALVATTDRERERELRGAGGATGATAATGTAVASSTAAPTSAATTLRARGASYRLYRTASSVSDWTYVAALDEARVLEGPREVMVAAILVLLACFLIGTAASYAFARRNARPVDRLIRLILGETEQGSGGTTSVFQRVEEAIIGLEVENRRLEGVAVSASAMARANFLQALLVGSYRDRARLTSEAGSVGVDLSGGRFVMVAGIGTAGVSIKEAGEDFTRAMEGARAALAEGEYSVSVSPGEAALVLAAGQGGEGALERATRAAEAIRAACSPDFRGALSFGAGAAVEDPFLLTISYAQAESARSRAARAGSLDVLAWADGERRGEESAYSMDLEEAVMRAVRSGNVDLLGSLLDSLNAPARGRPEGEPGPGEAPGSEAEEDLASALRGTALRLFDEFPKDSAALDARLRRARGSPPRSAIEELSRILAELAGLREGAKKSHNTALADGIRRFVAERYRDPNLGLAMVAEKFRFSENYLSNLYKEQTGECVSETIEAARIAAAKDAMRETGVSLEEIAASTGYRSVASFRRAFKRAVGLSPSDYRESIGRG